MMLSSEYGLLHAWIVFRCTSHRVIETNIKNTCFFIMLQRSGFPQLLETLEKINLFWLLEPWK